jgi:uncharacterized membrane protein YdjX (TVP38/TMEM64 family)
MSPVFISGWFVFGSNLFIYEFISSSIISIINYSIARKYGTNFLRKYIGDKGLAKVEEYSKLINGYYFLLIRFLTFSTNDYVSYAFGLTNIKPIKYIVSSIASNLLWCLLWRYVFIYTIGNFYMFFFWFIIGTIPFLIVLNIAQNKTRD